MIPVPPRSDALELLDTPGQLDPDLGANLRDIRRLNRWFGGLSMAVQLSEEILREYGRASVLDVACGSADIPMAMVRRARQSGRDLDIVASDISDGILAEARRRSLGAVSLVQADAADLPWADGAFDLVTCNLALHHFSPDDATRVLGEMWRVCRTGIAVLDLTRSYLAYAGTWAAVAVVARNRVTRHDGPLSVLRAYIPTELHRLASEAGIPQPLVRTHFPFRMSLTAVKDGAAG